MVIVVQLINQLDPLNSPPPPAIAKISIFFPFIIMIVELQQVLSTDNA